MLTHTLKRKHVFEYCLSLTFVLVKYKIYKKKKICYSIFFYGPMLTEKKLEVKSKYLFLT